MELSLRPFYQRNRKRLASALDDGIVVIASSAVLRRNGDVDYEFRQDSDFLYLTGIHHPGYALIIDGKRKCSHLFIPDPSIHHRIWLGHQINKSEAKHQVGTHEVHLLSTFAATLKRLARGNKILYAHPTAESLIKSATLTLPRRPLILRSALDELRVRKATEELNAMREANRISHAGHVAAMRATKPGCFEYQVCAVLEHQFRDAGAFHNAYPSIVATGANAAVLHYHDNNVRCQDGDLLLIDAGAEWNGYAADVTRTFPVNGRFNDRQREIYSLVLHTQKICIAAVLPGASMIEIHILAQKTLAAGLLELGIFKNISTQEILNKKLIQIFFPHGIGHLLGLDVHDVGSKAPGRQPKPDPRQSKIRTMRVLEPGFVVTVEPGLYFINAHFEDKKLRKSTVSVIDWQQAEAYRSVGGVRIEDDILVTANGPENLTSAPKEISEIEAVFKQAPQSGHAILESSAPVAS